MTLEKLRNKINFRGNYFLSIIPEFLSASCAQTQLVFVFEKITNKNAHKQKRELREQNKLDLIATENGKIESFLH